MHISLTQAITLLKNGEVVAIPTETVYGLAADATNPNALKKIYATKERPQSNPLIVHIADITQVNKWANVFPALAKKIAEAFWPGPLTLVLEAKPEVSPILTANQSTVALRVPNHPVALELLQKSGLSLAAPSANKYTQLSPTTAAHVEAGLGAKIPVLEGGACKVGIESTIVHVFQNVEGAWQWRILRQGMVSEMQIVDATGLKPAANARSATQKVQVPGQHHLHYSPKTPLALVSGKDKLLEKVKKCVAENKSCAVLLLQDSFTEAAWPCEVRLLPHSAALYAEHLYAILHDLDALKVSQLFVEAPPETPEWQPILDRLQRAAHV
jgi:L-threonylcarbamoyladenylate synthase